MDQGDAGGVRRTTRSGRARTSAPTEAADELPTGGDHIYPNPLIVSQRRVDLILRRLRGERAESRGQGDAACAR